MEKSLNMKEKIVKWLKNYSESNNNRRFVIGVSGGIDSALTSTLCAETGINTIVVSMPIHQNKDQLQRAHNHIKWLQSKYENIQYYEYNLSHVYDTFAILFADNENKLGNKVEDFGVGFYTKYGDGGVDISPIGDLMKSEVRKLSKQFGILDEIIKAPPTDGLWDDDRTDEDQIGATYEELEWAMGYEGKVEDLLGKQKEIYYIYSKLHKENKHKMEAIPIFKSIN
jgi:NAD+ synthase